MTVKVIEGTNVVTKASVTKITPIANGRKMLLDGATPIIVKIEDIVEIA